MDPAFAKGLGGHGAELPQYHSKANYPSRRVKLPTGHGAETNGFSLSAGNRSFCRCFKPSLAPVDNPRGMALRVRNLARKNVMIDFYRYSNKKTNGRVNKRLNAALCFGAATWFLLMTIFV